ncbi:MAG TPA: PLP-dependent aminotransferase family protein [Noviherbaspirillum sp.]|uniref:MocR-like pyridoxine biosynthesis transcription factor PdxR n=1 Tax=Noviherbaspirillum sp. TaxID=1926288 RepID=UPI002D6BD1E4|nr:PLP-dependent aminotransferase family protein [Noviherbaspirillum sp.]HYD97206.1 PLP-dependent aminotransferase family protein [Noviherbaspirillum sp.]
MHLAQSLATLRFDPSSKAPMFKQLYEAIKQTVLTGKLAPGMQLPPTRELASQLGVSRQTVLNAYVQLTAEGYLSGTVGKGTFVSAHLPLAQETRADAAGQKPQLLRPLSARGRHFTGPQAALNIHAGSLRAFRIGMPGLDVFPFETWARLEARRWRRPPQELGYGDPAGYRPLREALCAYLAASRGVHCDPDCIIITSGSQQSLYLLATLLLGPGDAAWVEDPGYRGISASLRAAEVEICPVPVDAQGLRIDAAKEACPHAKMAYVTPSHQLPLGVTMSLQRRLELLAWAQAARAWIVEDDYDSEYRYTGPPLASLQSLDQAGCVIYVGTLSKVLFPGLRLGYLVLPAGLVDAFVQARAILDRQAAIVPQIVLADFIVEGHFSRHIKRTREVYAERRAVLLEEIGRQLGEHLRCGPADAGLQLSATFRTKRSDQAVARMAAEHGIELRPLSQFYLRERDAQSGLVLGFASIPAEEIRRGAAVLRAVLEK